MVMQISIGVMYSRSSISKPYQVIELAVSISESSSLRAMVKLDGKAITLVTTVMFRFESG